MRLVLDTNVWLDWLVFDDPVIQPIRAAVLAGRATVFTDDSLIEELSRVLAYPLGRFTLDAAGIHAAVAACRSAAVRMETPTADFASRHLPVCRDPDDQKFLALALAAKADALLTKDRALLELSRHRARTPFRIVPPERWDMD